MKNSRKSPPHIPTHPSSIEEEKFKSNNEGGEESNYENGYGDVSSSKSKEQHRSGSIANLSNIKLIMRTPSRVPYRNPSFSYFSSWFLCCGGPLSQL